MSFKLVKLIVLGDTGTEVSEAAVSETTGKLSAKNLETTAESDQEEVLMRRVWSPLLFHMAAKFVFRWIVLPLFVTFVHASDFIILCVYPLLVLPG